MSESGGKLAVMRQQARQAVASAPGRVIGEAARAEIQPVMDRLDEMTRSLDALPERMEVSAASSAVALRESLEPMVEQVRSLRSSLELLPTLLAQQTDGVVAQIQGEGRTMRREIEILRGGLSTLPDALALQLAPILVMAERLDEVLAVQRSSLAALHEESLQSFRTALEPTSEKLETGIALLTKRAAQMGGALQAMKSLPEAMRAATAEAKTVGVETAEEIRKARGRQWHPAMNVLATAVLTAMILGALLWLGTQSSNRLLPLGGVSSKERAWDALYGRAPEWRETMDRFLAASDKR